MQESVAKKIVAMCKCVESEIVYIYHSEYAFGSRLQGGGG